MKTHLCYQSWPDAGNPVSQLGWLQIEVFVPEASFRVKGQFLNDKGVPFEAKLPKAFATEQEAMDFLEKNKRLNNTITIMSHHIGTSGIYFYADL